MTSLLNNLLHQLLITLLVNVKLVHVNDLLNRDLLRLIESIVLKVELFNFLSADSSLEIVDFAFLQGVVHSVLHSHAILEISLPLVVRFDYFVVHLLLKEFSH
jgi:hypothetical protein